MLYSLQAASSEAQGGGRKGGCLLSAKSCIHRLGQ